MRGVVLALGLTILSACSSSPSTGTLQVTIDGLPSGVNGYLIVTGPNYYNRFLSSTQTLSGLPIGSYSVVTIDVTNDGYNYAGTVTGSPANVTASASAAV